MPHEYAPAFLRIWSITTLALADRMAIWSCVIEKPRNRLRRRQLQSVLLHLSLVK